MAALRAEIDLIWTAPTYDEARSQDATTKMRLMLVEPALGVEERQPGKKRKRKYHARRTCDHQGGRRQFDHL